MILANRRVMPGVVLDVGLLNKDMSEELKQSVLFVCVHNSARSQMAEALQG